MQVIPPARNLGVYARCGFDVVTMANNHIVDGGHAAMLDTRARLNVQGVATCGAGRNLTEARAPADLVIATFHWGDFMKPFHLTDHEIRTARFCIDEGADMVVGHHHHVLRGMEWYEGKPILYGLGHFVFDLRVELPPDLLKMIEGSGEDPNFYGVAPREGWPLLPLHAESRMTLMVWASVDAGSITGIGFVPCVLRPDGLVHPVDPVSTEGRDVVAYVEKGCTTQNLNARLEPAEFELGGCPAMQVVPADS